MTFWVHDIVRLPVEELVREGAKEASSPKEAAEQADDYYYHGPGFRCS